MVSPLDLSERQLLIYRVLYARSNFDTMLVNMTVDQVISQIKIVDLSYKVVYSEIQKLQQLGYIELVKKASKGNAPIYKIASYNEIIGKPKGNQRETKRKPKHSNSNRLKVIQGNQRETKGKPKGNTIKEKEKENNNIWSFDSDQLDYLWSIYPRKQGKKEAFNMLPDIINQYGYEQIERCLSRYLKEIKENGVERQYIQQGKTFFKSGYIDYLDDNYEDIEIKQEPKQKINWV